ncbi:zinc ribbon domain-containing protein [Dermacoccaceae bacterium W4C1]
MLDLQKLDTRLAQLDHRADHLPVAQQLADAQKRRDLLAEEVVLAGTAVGDVDREITKAEQDVQLVRDRAARNTARLEAGQGSAKDLQGLQHELETLARRQSELEDVELEVMERAEQLRADAESKKAAAAEAEQAVTTLTAQRDADLAEIDSDRTAVRAERGNVAPGLGAELLALYEKVRDSHGGVGAAALSQRRCGGCQLELNAAELSRIRSAPEDEVLRCEECGRILVRTAESGL